jgi:hypothetical protein
MKDIRAILLAPLLTAINTATGKTCHTRQPKEANIGYPYIYISEFYLSEVGPKTNNEYQADVAVQVCYMDATSLVDMYNDMDDIAGLINHDKPFALASGYEILSCELNNSSTSEFQTETGTLNIGLIRMIFNIKEL